MGSFARPKGGDPEAGKKPLPELRLRPRQAMSRVACLAAVWALALRLYRLTCSRQAWAVYEVRLSLLYHSFAAYARSCVYFCCAKPVRETRHIVTGL